MATRNRPKGEKSARFQPPRNAKGAPVRKPKKATLKVSRLQKKGRKIAAETESRLRKNAVEKGRKASTTRRVASSGAAANKVQGNAFNRAKGKAIRKKRTDTKSGAQSKAIGKSKQRARLAVPKAKKAARRIPKMRGKAVSYTHLTLPTILLV